MALRASALFSAKAADLFSFVYGRAPSALAGGRQLGDDDDDDDGVGGGRAGDDDNDDDNFFQPAKKKSEAEAAHDLEAVDGEMSTKSITLPREGGFLTIKTWRWHRFLER